MKKILLSHQPGTGGNLIASLLSKQTTSILEKKNIKIKGNFKNREFELRRLNKGKFIGREITNFYKKNNIVTTHLTDLKIVSHNLIKIKTQWENKELGKWFAIRDLMTTSVMETLPYHYSNSDSIIKKIMSDKLDETEKILLFFENHYKNGGWFNNKTEIDKSWKVFNIDNILNNFCFVEDIENLCIKINIPFHRAFVKNLHNKWLKKNNQKQINLVKLVDHFKKNNFIELMLQKINKKK